MFSGMGMFGAFGFDPEEETKKNEEMKREAELRKKYEENLDKPITITQRQLMEAQAHVMAKGKFMSMAEKNDSLDQQATDLQLALAEVYEQIIS